MSPNLTNRPPRSPKLRLHGVAGLPRLLDKARAAATNQLGDYVYGADSSVDRRLLHFLGLTAEALQITAAKESDDHAVATWIEREGSRRTQAANAQWTHEFLNLLARDDPDRQAYIGQVLAHTPLPAAATTTCDWLEFDDRISFGLERRIAIIGAGKVGGALGARWARAGHTVTFGVRDPAAAKVIQLLAATGGNSRVSLPFDAASEAEIVVLATPWAAVSDALVQAGDLSGKILVDCTNPLTFVPDVGLQLVLGHHISGAEQVQTEAAGAHVVKAFNTYGWENFANSHYAAAGDGDPVMFIAGNHPDACSTVGRLASDIGFAPFQAGGLAMARYLEPTAMLWILNGRHPERGPDFTWQCLTR